MKYINNGNIQGYIAYYDGKAVGWCNANAKSECYDSFCWKMSMGAVHKDSPSVKVKSVFCFCISPEMRGKGVAEILLRQVCEDVKKDSFEFVEAYPNKEFINTELDFMGPIGLYEKLGFNVLYEIGSTEHNSPKIIMRKKLN